MESYLDEIKRKLESYCAYQERCIRDVRTKMASLDVPLLLHDDLIRHLQSERFLDELRFGETYVSGKFQINKWGKRKIYFALHSKGLSKELIYKSLETIDSDMYFDTLCSLALSKYRMLCLKKEATHEKRAKLVRFLSQRGFESDLISDAIALTIKS